MGKTHKMSENDRETHGKSQNMSKMEHLPIPEVHGYGWKMSPKEHFDLPVDATCSMQAILPTCPHAFPQLPKDSSQEMSSIQWDLLTMVIPLIMNKASWWCPFVTPCDPFRVAVHWGDDMGPLCTRTTPPDAPDQSSLDHTPSQQRQELGLRLLEGQYSWSILDALQKLRF